jgi:hypothetical protein
MNSTTGDNLHLYLYFYCVSYFFFDTTKVEITFGIWFFDNYFETSFECFVFFKILLNSIKVGCTDSSSPRIKLVEYLLASIAPHFTSAYEGYYGSHQWISRYPSAAVTSFTTLSLVLQILLCVWLLVRVSSEIWFWWLGLSGTSRRVHDSQ